MKQVRILTMLVDNEFGVLTRVTALIRREGWNIKSLSVAETLNPAVSRLTLGVECRSSTLEHVMKRLERLACVREVFLCETSGRELAIARLPKGSPIPEGARAVQHDEILTVEYSGAPSEVDAWIKALEPLGVIDVARTGVIVLS